VLSASALLAGAALLGPGLLGPGLAGAEPPASAGAAAGAGRSAAGLITAPAPLVDPFIGTNGIGNESPGAHAPFGMVTWGPDTPAGGDGGGYRHSDTHITGFSVTHLSGVGCHAAGEVPLLPEVGTVRPTGSIAFSHHGETASAGGYAVTLGNHVRVALTATARTGLARFTFPATKRADLVLKLAGDGDTGLAKPSAVRLRVVSDTEVRGTVTSGDFCGSGNRYTVYFDMRFSLPFSHSGTFSGVRLHPGSGRLTARGRATSTPRRGPVPPTVAEPAGQPVFHGTPPVAPAPVLASPAGGYLTFDTTRTRTVLAKVGLSYVSRANAQQNLAAEDPGWNLGAIEARNNAAWNALLGRVRVTAGPQGAGTEQRVFYTALYRSLSYPSVFSDDNGQYRGMDGKIHTVAAGHAFYTNISGWDVYRTQSQLLALLDPAVADDAAQSMLADHAQGGELPKWVEDNTETHIMVGDPADAILADYHAFGATGFDAATALADMVSEGTYATPNRPGLNYLTSPGYLPRNGTYCGRCNYYAPTSATLEYGTADFAVSALAGALGDAADQRAFLTRAQDWQNLLNPRSGFFQARTVSGAWVGKSSQPTSETGFAEGDAWQYSGMVPFNLAGLIAAKGGNGAMTGYLGQVLSGFSGGVTSSTADMANEPSMELPWEYDYAARPFQTQATVRKIQDALWRATPHGLAGNDDMGTMSAWFVWSALGAYPMTPGTSVLALGSPLFTQADVTLGPGATLTIAGDGATATDGTTAGTPYVHAAAWTPAGGTAGAWDHAYAPGQSITAGGTLTFDLAASQDMTWGAGSPPPSYPAPHPPAGRTGATVSAVGTNLCLDDAHGRTANGNKIDIYHCNGTAAQHWAVRTDQTVRTLGRCLTPAGGGTASGTPIVLSACHGSGAQRWQAGQVGTLVNVGSQRCLADPSASHAKGTQVVLRNCARAIDQKWVLPYAGPLPPAGRVHAAAAGKCLTDADGSTRPHNKIDISACTGHADQRWSIDPDGTVHSRLGGCLDVSHGRTASGSAVDYYPCDNTAAQQWRSQAGGALVNAPARKCLTVPGDGRASGKQLVLAPCDGGSAQRWRLP
jgi:predicted alpha-1,2-mannosidase